MQQFAALDVGERVAAVFSAKRGAVLACPPLWLSLRGCQHKQILLVGLDGLWQLLRNFQQLIILIFQLFLSMDLPYPIQNHFYLLLSVCCEPIEDVILLLTVYFRLKSLKQLRCVLILLHPSQNPTLV